MDRFKFTLFIGAGRRRTISPLLPLTTETDNLNEYYATLPFGASGDSSKSDGKTITAGDATA
jgi:hypothetical protein